MLLTLVVTAGVCIGGLVLLGLGMRGRLVDGHVLCRKCGFDLFGLPQDAYRCSECGADLRQPRSTRVGHRARRGVLIVLGASLMLPCLAWMGLLAYVAIRGTDINPYKPTWMLLNEAAGRDVQSRDAALKELFRRVSAQTLSVSAMNRIIEHSLRVQADPAKPWVAAWGDIVERAHSRGRISADQWRLYVKQAPQIQLRIRPKIRQGAALPIARDYSARVGKNGAVFVKRKGTPASVDEHICDDYMGRGLEIAHLSIRPDTNASIIPAAGRSLAELAIGRHSLKWVLGQWVYDSAPRDFADTLAPLAFRQHELQTSFEVVAEPTVTLLPRPDLQAPIARCLAVRLRRIGLNRINGGIAVQSAPVSLAFDVYFRHGQAEWKAGTLATAASSSQTWFSLGANTDVLGDTCDVILRSSREAAEQTTDLTEIWDGQILLPNILIEPTPPMPTTRRR